MGVSIARRGWLGFAFLLLIAGQVSAAGPDLRLVDAAAQQDWKTVRALLQERGADVNASRADGATALLWAAHWDALEMIDVLLRAGARVNAAEDHGVTPLARACENASLPAVERLLKGGADPNARQTSGLTPLMIAAETGNVALARTLLVHGADANVAAATGDTALMWAVAAPHPEIVRVLIEGGADVRASSKKGFTPLLFAARNGDIEMAKILLAAGAGVNDTGSDGIHALPLSIINRREKFAMFLLEEGADPNGSIEGVTALHATSGNVGTWLNEWARAHGGRTGERAGSLGPRGLNPDARLRLVQALLARGANPNARIPGSAVVLGYLATPRRGAFEQNAVGTGDVRGATPLWVAAFSANGGGLFGEDQSYQFDSSAAILQALLTAGADHRLTTDDGTTPLMAAAGIGHRSYQPTLKRGERSPNAEAAVKVLVDAGAEVNAANEADYTALHAAAFRGWNEVVEYLIEHGANINARDFRGRTPFRVAEGTKQSFQFQAWPETAALLKRLGADTRLGIPGTVHERADRDVATSDQQQ
jgi:ankyrin repeat protein